MVEKWKEKHDYPDMSLFGDNLERVAAAEVESVKRNREITSNSIRMISTVDYVDEDFQRLSFTPYPQYKSTQFYEFTEQSGQKYYIQADNDHIALQKLHTFYGKGADDIKIIRNISWQEYSLCREKFKVIPHSVDLEV